MQHRPRLRRLLPLIVLPFVLAACNVAIFSNFDGTESLKELKLDGDFVAGHPLTISIEVNDAYPVPVRIACYYEDPDAVSDDQKRILFEERATEIGETVLPASPDTKPKDEVERQTLSFPFTLDQPGNYFAACITPASPENGIGESFTIEPATTTSP
ncbi:MAG TPA: hypothetical protein VFY10_10375 [Dehalococcoidia bacterium]|nr:hypothetical protein [Dehalococcoidia bacterium]